MATLMVALRVENFVTWKKFFDDSEEFRKRLGIVVKGIYQKEDDENQLTLISDYPSTEMIKEILSDPQWEHNQKKSGVKEFIATIWHKV